MTSAAPARAWGLYPSKGARPVGADGDTVIADAVPAGAPSEAAHARHA